jgi:hypothetical protein
LLVVSASKFICVLFAAARLNNAHEPGTSLVQSPSVDAYTGSGMIGSSPCPDRTSFKGTAFRFRFRSPEVAMSLSDFQL